MEHPRAHLWQSLGPQPGDLTGLSLPGGCSDQWTSAKGLWGRQEAWRSCISSHSSLSCTYTLYFLSLGHGKSVWNCPEGSLCSLSHQSSIPRQLFEVWLSSVGEVCVPNHRNGDGVNDFLDSRWFLHSPSDVYTRDTIQAVHLTSLWFPHLSNKRIR